MEHGHNNYRPSRYQVHLNELIFEGINLLVKVTDVVKFERQNPDLSVNIYGWMGGALSDLCIKSDRA